LVFTFVSAQSTTFFGPIDWRFLVVSGFFVEKLLMKSICCLFWFRAHLSQLFLETIEGCIDFKKSQIPNYKCESTFGKLYRTRRANTPLPNAHWLQKPKRNDSHIFCEGQKTVKHFALQFWNVPTDL
jgi:hypothetical protein